MADTDQSKSTYTKVVLSLQICLALWQVIKLTVFAAGIKAFVCRCVSMLPCSLLPSSYSPLEELESEFFIFKLGQCLVTKEADDQGSVAQEVSEGTSFRINYLGDDFHLERKETYKLFVNEKMAYYITDVIWHSLLGLKMVNSSTVFLKGLQILGHQYAYAGGLMDLFEVLDCSILRNRIVKKPLLLLRYDNDDNNRFMPINLSISEEKILKGVNIIGVFLQTKKHVHWLIPLLLSFTSAVLEFCTPLRVWIYNTVNQIFCWAMHPLCDRLPLVGRVGTYSVILGWVEKMRPSNDMEWRAVRGVKSAVIGGGAKVCLQNASLILSPIQLETPSSCEEFSSQGKYPRARLTYDATGRKLTIQLCLDERHIFVDIRVDCEVGKYAHLRTFMGCLVRNRSGSLECCEAKGRVCKVRSFRQSITCYIKNGFPEVFELTLENATVT